MELIHGAMTSLAKDNNTQQQQPIKLIHVSIANKKKNTFTCSRCGGMSKVGECDVMVVVMVWCGVDNLQLLHT